MTLTRRGLLQTLAVVAAVVPCPGTLSTFTPEEIAAAYRALDVGGVGRPRSMHWDRERLDDATTDWLEPPEVAADRWVSEHTCGNEVANRRGRAVTNAAVLLMQ